MSDFNRQVVEQFRASSGHPGGQFEGEPLLLLHTTGAKSGAERINPMIYRDLGGPVAVFASRAGAPVHPDWYHNLVAHPEVTAEIGAETRRFVARTAEGEERRQIWAEHTEQFPRFAEYQEKTTRQIPVVVLDPI